jgi:hypothetical protein
MIFFRIQDETYHILPKNGKLFQTIYDWLGYSMYYYFRHLHQNIVCFTEIIDNFPENTIEINYTNESSSSSNNLIQFDYKEHLAQINYNYSKIVLFMDNFNDAELAIIEQNAEDKNMNPLLYIETYYNPNCIIRIQDDCFNLKLEYDKILVIIAERLAYYRFKNKLQEDDCFHDIDIKYRDEITQSFIIYNYREHLSQINNTYETFVQNLCYSDNQLSIIDKFSEENHFNDPLTLYKSCHYCEKETHHYLHTCNKICKDNLDAYKIKCIWGLDCPICKQSS